jgi:hypothetical protein
MVHDPLLQRRQVECEPEKCPGNQGCYRLLNQSKDGCCRVCKGKLMVAEVVTKLSDRLCTPRRFVTVFTRTRHWDPIPGQMNPVHLISCKICFNIIHVSTRVLCSINVSLLKCLIISRFPFRVTCPTHFILLELMLIITVREKDYKLLSSSCNFLHSSVTSSLSGPDTPSLCSVTLGDQVSRPVRQMCSDCSPAHFSPSSF